MPDAFPSLKARQMLTILQRLGYEVTRQSGSHRKMEALGRPVIFFSFHDRATLPSGMVRTILVKQIGLSDEEARALL